MSELPDRGEWILEARTGVPLPPFVKLEVDFEHASGSVQGMQRSNSWPLRKVTVTAGNRFGALYSLGNNIGSFDAALQGDGSLSLRFLGSVTTACTARPIRMDRDAASAGEGPLYVASVLIDAFESETRPGAFPRISRAEVARQLRHRIANPLSLDQGPNNTCGPAAFLYAIVRNDPVAYTRYVTSLYDCGVARIGGLEVRPSSGFRFDAKHDLANALDWITLGSLRDSTNWLVEYHNSAGTWGEGFRGGTTDGEMATWFRRAGFTDVVSKTSLIPKNHADLDNLRLADQYYRRGYKVCLSVCANFLEANDHATQAAGGSADHFVVLASPIEFGRYVRFRMFTWAGAWDCPPLTAEELLNSYYGFTAARR